jgi:hypothetical protein
MGLVLLTPYFAQGFIPREHVFGVLCQELQCLAFLRGDRDLLGATR